MRARAVRAIINIDLIAKMDHEPDHLDPKHGFGDEAYESNVLINILLTPRVLNHHQLFKDCYAREKEGSLFVFGTVVRMWLLAQKSGGLHALKVSELVYDYFLNGSDTKSTTDAVGGHLRWFNPVTRTDEPRKCRRLLVQLGRALEEVRTRMYNGGKLRSAEPFQLHKNRIVAEVKRREQLELPNEERRRRSEGFASSVRAARERARADVRR